MRWFKPGLRHSLSAFLGPQASPDPAEALEPVRRALLDALGEHGARSHPQLRRRLAYLADAQALWHARADVVAALSQVHGEAKAVETVQRLSPLFEGLLPRSLMDACRTRR
jgi:hypothetical protein